MPETLAKKHEHYEKTLRANVEAKLRAAYAEAALSASKSGRDDLYAEFSQKANEAKERHDKLRGE